MTGRLMIAVCGTSQSSAQEDDDAREVGRLLAERGAVIVNGGTTGVMTSSAEGASLAGGTSIGLLPGDDSAAGNEHLDFALPTGLGEMRNAMICRMTAGMVVIGGGWGTLSEIGFMLRAGKPVVALRSWDIRQPGAAEPDPTIHQAATAVEAVDWILDAVSTATNAR